MDQINFFKDLFESIPKYRKIVLLMILIKNDADILQEFGFLKNDNNCGCSKFFKSLMEENEDDLEYITIEEESVIGRNPNK